MNESLVAALPIILIMFFASFTQSVAGFGVTLVAMPVLADVIGVRVAAPFLALIAVVIQLPMLIRYRKSMDMQAVSRLIIPVVIGIPIGIFGLKRLDADFVITILGVVVISYALYALLAPTLPEMKRPVWAYPIGLIAGLLAGAYSAAGPPLIIYGDSNRWKPAEFKSNLQGLFMVISAVQISTHALAGNLTTDVWKNVLIGLPSVLLGIVVGLSLDKYINPDLFRKIVLVLLVVLGFRLVF